MNDAPSAPGKASPPPSAPPIAQVRRQRRGGFQAVWLLPIIAALIAGWLVWRSVAREGPQIVVTFRTADGITGGQTKVRHKAVDLGTVQTVQLSQDLQHVEVRIAMLASAERMLTKQARFWVVRPRLGGGSISGLDTVLSGSYIEMDPGTPEGELQTRYTGLEDPPAVRSDEPGTPFVLKADRIGSLASGSGIYFHDIPAGEVLNYDLNPQTKSVVIHAFIRAPYDKFVTPAARFWDSSGLDVNVGAQGIQVRVTSLRAALTGGIAFDDIGLEGDSAQPSPPDAAFPLFATEAAAQEAGYRTQIKLVTFFESSVRGLAVGAPVELNGIQVGAVTDVHLLFDPERAAEARVAVHMQVQPQRFLPPEKIHPGNTLQVARALVRHGLRAQLSTANFLTGQMLVEFGFDSTASPAEARMDGDEVVLPGTSGGFDSITSNLAAITNKLRALPLDSVVHNLNDTLHGVSAVINGAPLRQTLDNFDAASRQLPVITRELDSTLAQAGKLVASANGGYGQGSEFRRDLERLLQQASDTARSVRLLADYLSIHPEALIRGRTGQATSR